LRQPGFVVNAIIEEQSDDNHTRETKFGEDRSVGSEKPQSETRQSSRRPKTIRSRLSAAERSPEIGRKAHTIKRFIRDRSQAAYQ